MEENTLKIPTPKYRSGDVVGVALKQYYNQTFPLVKGIVVDTNIHLKRDGEVVIRYNVSIPNSGAHGYREEEVNSIPTLEEYE